VETSDVIPLSEQKAWYSVSMKFLSMPTDNLGESLIFTRLELISSFARSQPSVSDGFSFLILLGLLVGLMLLCRLVQGSAMSSAFPVGNHARR